MLESGYSDAMAKELTRVRITYTPDCVSTLKNNISVVTEEGSHKETGLAAILNLKYHLKR